MNIDSPSAQLRRGVTMRDLDRAARRFSADVAAMQARSDPHVQPMIAALAVIMLGSHLDRGTLELALAGSKDIFRNAVSAEEAQAPA
jgi:hypothetical protein